MRKKQRMLMKELSEKAALVGLANLPKKHHKRKKLSKVDELFERIKSLEKEVEARRQEVLGLLLAQGKMKDLLVKFSELNEATRKQLKVFLPGIVHLIERLDVIEPKLEAFEKSREVNSGEFSLTDREDFLDETALDMLDMLDLDVRTVNCLRKNEVATVDEIESLGFDGLIILDGIGRKRARVIIDAAINYRSSL